MKKINTIFYLAGIAWWAFSFSPINAIPTVAQLLGQHVLIISDYHEDIDDECSSREHQHVIAQFIANESTKPYQTAILLEINQEVILSELENTTFLIGVGQSPNQSPSNVSIVQADRRNNFLCGTEGITNFHRQYLTADSEDDVLSLIATPRQRAQLLEEAADICDGDITFCISNLHDFVALIQSFVDEKLQTENMNAFKNLMHVTIRDFSGLIDTLHHSFDFIPSDHQAKVTLLDAVFQKMQHDQSTDFLTHIAEQIAALNVFMFDICALMELVQNLQENKRIILCCGAFHAQSIIYYLTHMNKTDDLVRPMVEQAVHRMLCITQGFRPMLAQQFHSILRQFAAIPALQQLPVRQQGKRKSCERPQVHPNKRSTQSTEEQPDTRRR